MLERLPDDGWLYELVEGRVVRMPPPGTDHGPAEGNIYLALALHVRPHGLEEALLPPDGGGDVSVGGPRRVPNRPRGHLRTALAPARAAAASRALPSPRPPRGPHS